MTMRDTVRDVVWEIVLSQAAISESDAEPLIFRIASELTSIEGRVHLAMFLRERLGRSFSDKPLSFEAFVDALYKALLFVPLHYLYQNELSLSEAEEVPRKADNGSKSEKAGTTPSLKKLKAELKSALENAEAGRSSVAGRASVASTEKPLAIIKGPRRVEHNSLEEVIKRAHQPAPATSAPHSSPPQASAPRPSEAGRASVGARQPAPATSAPHSSPPPASALPPTATPRLAKGEYTVWYGTNRRPLKVKNITRGYSPDRDSKLHYGFCRIYIPQSHKIGSLGSSWWKRLITRTDDRLKMRKIKEIGSTAFWQQIASRLAKVSIGERHAVIFVHGYNVSFNDAALRAAQIGYDLAIKGAMAFFSWPSQGTLGGYMADAATIEASEQDISNFMIDFVTRSSAKAVHIIAHSMGNRGVLRAVNKIAERAQQETGVPFGQVILAAADVDSDTFRQLSGAYARVARRTTLYVSERDRAVEASHWLHQFPRVGLMPPISVTPNIDTVSVTNVDLTLLGHGYIGEARGVLTDIHQLITKGLPPDQRFGLSEAMTTTGDRYWLIRS
jgi:esterase/lipase superfamily enzyme